MADFGDEAQRYQDAATKAALSFLPNLNAAQGCDDCAECGEEIDPRRRAAMPSARLCIDCQEELER